MKLMVAKCCGEIVVPCSIKDRPRFCECKNSAVWWDDPHAGELVVWRLNDLFPMPEVLDISNSFLMVPISRLGMVDKSTLHATCDAADGYLFKTLDSPIIRVAADFRGIKGIRVVSNLPNGT